MNVRATLEKQLGPLPLWGWAVAIGGAVIAFIILPKVLSHFSGQSQDSGTSAAGLGIDPSTGLPTGILPGGGTTPTADNSSQLNDILAQEQAIVSGQQAMEDEFKKFMDEILGIRDGLTPPTSPPGPVPAQLPPGAEPPVPVGPDGQPINPPFTPPAQQPPGGEVDPWAQFRPGPPTGTPQPPNGQPIPVGVGNVSPAAPPGRLPPGPQPPIRPGSGTSPYNTRRPR